ncbi:MAG: recombination mediator RecR, partial [Planctomycetota bacterium]
LTEQAMCPICGNTRRDASVVLIVEQPKDLLSLEQTGMFNGVYHVLMGRLAPLEQIGPEDLTIDHLMDRVRDPQQNVRQTPVREVIFGLSPNLEGDGTVLYLSDLLANFNVRLTRLARGLPSGSQLEYASKAVLADAIVGRQQVTDR